MPGGIKKGDDYTAKGCKHLRNERAYASHSALSTGRQVTEVLGERACKRQQMGTIFHLLQMGRPMLEYKTIQQLLVFLGVPKIPKKHWSDGVGWIMAKCMHQVVESKAQETIQATKYLSVFCDEVTSIDNASWISIHCYVVQDWARLPILISLEHVTEGATANNLTKVIVNAVTDKRGLTDLDLAAKMMSFGADGISLFQGKRRGVVKQLQEKYSPTLTGIHCMVCSLKFELYTWFL